jgi:hypothetical protein
MKRLIFIYSTLLFLALLTGCGPGFQTNQTGPQGASPVIGSNPATPAECAFGGLEITSNGVVIGIECNGANGSNGSIGATGPQGNTGATGATGPQGPQGVAPTPAPADPIDVQIASILSNENAYRLALGQTELSAGLSCTLQAVSAGSWLSSSSPGYVAAQGVLTLIGTQYSYLYEGAFDQANSGPGSNNLIPVAIQPLFTNNNYKINCTGQIVILATAYYEFDLSSDDGSILTIDGAQVANNDGTHGITTASGTKLLRSGVHTFNLQYAQSGGGNFALILNSNGVSIDPRQYAH